MAHWYKGLPPPQAHSLAQSEITALYKKAESLHSARLSQPTTTKNGSTSESSFLSKVVQSGTLSDRLSALTLLVQNDPISNTSALDTLKSMAERGKGKGGREESLKALRLDQPLSHPKISDEYLMLWFFEDWLKKYFFSVLQILEALSLDPPTLQQEHNLLRLLTNKLGDPEKSICSRASYHILQVLQSHPAMKGVLVREISALVLRPPAAPTAAPLPGGGSTGKHIRFDNAPKPKPKGEEKKPAVNTHARYYGTITLNQIVLSSTDKSVASALLDVYFDLFKDILGEDSPSSSSNSPPQADSTEDQEVKVDKQGRILSKKQRFNKKHDGKEYKGAAGFTELEDAHSKLVSAILTGMHRAFPFAPLDNNSRIEKHLDTLFLITHTSTFNTSLQALVLIQQISASLESAASSSNDDGTSKGGLKTTSRSTKDRYYRTLYSSLHDPRLADSSKQAMYLNLLFKSIKHLTTISSPSPSSSASTSTTRRSKKSKKGGSDAVESAHTGGDENEEDRERMVALIRRFVQVLVSSGNGTTEFVVGGLYLLGELFSTIPNLRSILNSSPSKLSSPSSSQNTSYDPLTRQPSHAHSASSPLYELLPLTAHFHPTISLCARQLLLSQPLSVGADLSQNTLMHFLDRFVYRNAKKVKGGEDGEGAVKGKGPSAMQPAASALEGVKLVKGDSGHLAEGRMNDAKFVNKRREEVPVDQRFFHDFFSSKLARDKAKSAKVAKRKGGDDSSDSGSSEDEAEEIITAPTNANASSSRSKGTVADDEDVDEEDEDEGSDLDEDEVWRVMQASMPKAGDESDLDMSDMSEEEDEDDLEGFSELDSGAEDDVDADENDPAGKEEEEEEDVKVKVGKASQGEDEDGDEDDEDALSLVEDSDNDDLLSLNDDIPVGHLSMLQVDSDSDEEWGGVSSKSTKAKSKGAIDEPPTEDANGNSLKTGKRKRAAEEIKARRKKLRSLPTFASYEDYQKLIEDGPEDDI
ncbi:ribosome biogenesis protein [Coprinopsis sp. MPI-PUGE-AT-0042]|nr:ribosome biogenesis protein [Coprinopsis sp. MPI-PUGE-AT-0042]